MTTFTLEKWCPSTAPLQVALLMQQPDTSQQILKPQGPSISQEQLASFPA
jgi:hypothetical protein